MKERISSGWAYWEKNQPVLLESESESMWRKLKSVFNSFNTYADLSPDLGMRRRINKALQSRPALALGDWYESFWRQRGVTQEVATLLYQQLEKYTGLSFARVIPTDRLEEDLKISLIAWFDWPLNLCDDFQQKFGIDISDCLDIRDLVTVEDLALFLNQQLLAVKKR